MCTESGKEEEERQTANAEAAGVDGDSAVLSASPVVCTPLPQNLLIQQTITGESYIGDLRG